MKKLAICFIIMLMFGGIFEVTMQNVVKDVPVISTVIEAIGPGVAYAGPPIEAIPTIPPLPVDIGCRGPN